MCGGVDSSYAVVHKIKSLSGQLKNYRWADPIPDEPRKYRKEVVGALLGYWLEKAAAKTEGKNFDHTGRGFSEYMDLKECVAAILKDSREKLIGLGKVDAEITLEEVGEHLPIKYKYVKGEIKEGKIEVTHPAAPEWTVRFSSVHELLAETARVFLQD